MAINKKTIYFSGNDLYSKISEILGNNGIKESISAAAFSEKSFIIIVAKLIKSFVEEKISEKDFFDSLQHQLNVDVKIAQNISRDIKEKILPFAESVEVNQKTPELKQAETQKKIGIPSANKNDIDIFPKIKPTTIEEKPEAIISPIKKIKKSPLPIKESSGQIKQSSGSDTYREPI